MLSGEQWGGFEFAPPLGPPSHPPQHFAFYTYLWEEAITGAFGFQALNTLLVILKDLPGVTGVTVRWSL